MSVKIEFYKKMFLSSKFIGAAYIPFSKLQGLITVDGIADLPYKGQPIHLQVR
jgi:hypothetical protein